MKKLILSLTSLAAFSTLAAGSVVKIVGTEGSWGLTFNGKPYFVNGGGGGGSKALLKEIGGNSFRTWGANAAKKDLDEAAKYGETVTIGFWLGHSKHGFNYKNPKALDDTERDVLETVKRIKDHPALLAYTLGNEMELGQPDPVEMWQFINRLAKKVVKPVEVPYAIYADGVSSKFYPSGWMGNTGAMKTNDGCTENPHSGDVCLKVSYAAKDNWAGIYWQDPPNDWGDKEGGVNLANATTLEFWARGEKGGEKVNFLVGGLTNKPFSDTGGGKREVTLKKTWTRYRIPLDGEDLSRIKTAFGFNFGGQGQPFAFYLDDIRYIGD